MLSRKDRSNLLPPKLIEAGLLEKAASNEIPSDEGAWWIMCQTAMTIFNLAVRRDPVNNAVLDEFWSEIATCGSEKDLISFLTNAANEQNARPLPYDNVMEIINYAGEQLYQVFSSPRHSIVKADKMVRPYRLRNTSRKTMDWLGKQPGKTIKEKLSGKNKILTQVNEYTYDIKENQVAMMLYKQLLKRVNDRINNGIGQNGYGDTDSAEIRKLLKIKKMLYSSHIADVKPVNHTVANNVLLGDKNYSIIWKAYLEMGKYDKYISNFWDIALSMYVKAVFVSLCAYITSFDSVQIFEERIDLSEEDEQLFECIVDYDKDSPLHISLSLDKQMIYMRPTGLSKNGTGGIDEYQLSFAGDCTCDLMEKRGYPVNIDVRIGRKLEELKIWADVSGINYVVNWCLDQIEAYLGHSLTYTDHVEVSRIGTCVYDVLANGAYTTVNEEALENVSSVAVVYEDNNATTVYEVRDHCVYPGAKELIYVSDAVGDKLRTEALMRSLGKIRNRVKLTYDDYFIYTVPDALEEFSQKKLKQCVKAWFPRSFPVWRSVAALTEILGTEKNVFQPTDVFVSIDLLGEVASAGLLTIKDEKRVQGYVCNHYPPFPEKESGEYITEYAFLKYYAKTYANKVGYTIGEQELDGLVKSGTVRSVLKEGIGHNYTSVENDTVNVFRVEYDKFIVRKSKNKWLSAFGKFWNEIRYLLPRESPVQYVNILNDVIMDFVSVEEVKSIIMDTHESFKASFKGIYCSVNEHINQGAYVFHDRLRKHKPTWTEYLPELSLEVIKDGNYAQLELVGTDISFDVMGEENNHVVEERLVLKAYEKEFRFPLKKKDLGRTSALIEAYITDKSFPLDHDVIVKLSVKYKYGFDNSYELTLRPENPNEKAFDEIIVEWANVKRENKSVNIWPPKTNLQPDENVLVEIAVTRDSLVKIESNIKRHMVCYVGHQDKSHQIAMTDRFLSQNIFRIRNIVLSELPEAKEFVSWFIHTKLYQYLGQIAGILKMKDIPEGFFQDNEGRDLSFFMGDCMQVMFSIGKYTPDLIQKFFVADYDKFNEKWRMKSMMDMLLKNSENESAIKVLINEVRSAVDEDAYRVKMDILVKELGKMCCFDSDLIYAFYNADEAFMNEMVKFILQGLKRMLARCERFGEKFEVKMQDKKRYLGYLEAILAVLRLRDPEKTSGFTILAVGSKEAKRTSNTIRLLDKYMKHPNSSVRFKLAVEKPESLSKMSDLTYALDLYLNGDKRAASIEVVGVDEEEDN